MNPGENRGRSFPWLPVLLACSLLAHLLALALVRPAVKQEPPGEEPLRVGLAYVEREAGEEPPPRRPPGKMEEEPLREQEEPDREALPRPEEPDEPDHREEEREQAPPSPAAPPEEEQADEPRAEERAGSRETTPDLEKTSPRAMPPAPETGPPGDPAARVREPQLDLDRFLRRIRERKIYPLAARRRGYEGRVVIRLRLDREGNAADIAVLESSGHRVLDRAALSLVEEALPFRHGAGREVVLDVPVQYSLVEEAVEETY
jgi:protein TonB